MNEIILGSVDCMKTALKTKWCGKPCSFGGWLLHYLAINEIEVLLFREMLLMAIITFFRLVSSPFLNIHKQTTGH